MQVCAFYQDVIMSFGIILIEAEWIIWADGARFAEHAVLPW